MLYKFCENHLADLYEAIKNNNIEEAQKIEHELTVQEECVACAYTFKAKGEVRNELLSFLKSEGFAVDARRKESLLDHFYCEQRGPRLLAVGEALRQTARSAR